MQATAMLATFAAECPSSRIPDNARDEMRRALLDVLGTILAGSQETLGKIITDFVTAQGGQGAATIAADGRKTSAMLAALANGTMGHALDYDDVGLFGHPSVAVVPAAMAVAEETGASGRDFIDACIIGFEVAGRLSAATTHEPYTRGYHGTSIYGVFGSTAAAGRLLGLNVEQMRIAFGIAGSLASGVRANFGTMTKPLHAGECGRQGIEAATLAKAGFTADPNIIETKVGYGDTLLGHSEYDPAKMVENLGSPFVIERGVGIKKFPCCYGNHAILDGMFEILAKRPINAEEVASIAVDGRSSSAQIYAQPELGLHGKFSQHYNIALAIVDGQVVRNSFTNDHIRDQRLRDLVAKTTLNIDDKRPADAGVTISIDLKNGERIVHQQTSIRGNFNDPLSWDEIVTKFNDNATLVVDAATADDLVRMVANLDSAPGVSAVTAAMAGRATAAAR